MCVRGYFKYLLHKRAGISELTYCLSALWSTSFWQNYYNKVWPYCYLVFDRWCKLLRCTKVASIVVMVLNGVSNTEMQKYPDSFPTLRNQFQTVSIKSLSTSKYTIWCSSYRYNVLVFVIERIGKLALSVS